MQPHALARDAVAEVRRTGEPGAPSGAALRAPQHPTLRAPLVPQAEAERHMKARFFNLFHTDAAGRSDQPDAEGIASAVLVGDRPAVPDLVRTRLGAGMVLRNARRLAHAPWSSQLVHPRGGRLRGVILVLEMTARDPVPMAGEPALAWASAQARHILPPGPARSAACLRLRLDAGREGLPDPAAMPAGPWPMRRALSARNAGGR